MLAKFYLKDKKNNIILLLPVTPKSYEISYSNDIQTVNATATGDINIVGARRLMNVKLSSFFTINEYYFLNKTTYPVNTAMDYIVLIKKWVDEKTVIQLTISEGDDNKLDFPFYIAGITYSESSTSNGDIDYTLELSEYREIKLPRQKVDEKNLANNKSRSQNAPPKKPKTYTVVSGDYLIKIARKVYGSDKAWHKIYEANKKVIGNNPSLIYPGQVYHLP